MRNTIRKNATKKITALLNSAIAIIACKPQSRVDDSFDNQYYLVDAATVLAWLADADNYSDAEVFTNDDGSLHVGGPYYFNESFTAYFDESVLADAAEYKGVELPAKQADAAPVEPVAPAATAENASGEIFVITVTNSAANGMKNQISSVWSSKALANAELERIKARNNSNEPHLKNWRARTPGLQLDDLVVELLIAGQWTPQNFYSINRHKVNG
jgi:hypothetical protein